MLTNCIFFISFSRNGEQLFYAGRVAHGEHQAAIFISMRTARILIETSELLADATYKTVPVQFKELFTVHGIANEQVNFIEDLFHASVLDSQHFRQSFPILYALTTSKHKALKKKILQHLVDIGARLFNGARPRILRFITDFDLGLMEAVAEVFPEAQARGCLFHYSAVGSNFVKCCAVLPFLNKLLSFRQGIDRKADKVGLAADRKAIPLVRQIVRMVMVLPLVPPDRADEAVQVETSRLHMLII